VLIDSGTIGFPIYPKGGHLLQNMAAAGLDPKAVKTVLISHLRGDHIYGLIDKDTNAQIFPDAEIIVPDRTQLVDAAGSGCDGPWADRKGLSQRIRATLATWKNVRPVDGEVELLQGVHAVRAPGMAQGRSPVSSALAASSC
jgi:glyoxylase-like metal-dependent hydrolase (beta-lactamase superfamily II)